MCRFIQNQYIKEKNGRVEIVFQTVQFVKQTDDSNGPVG